MFKIDARDAYFIVGLAGVCVGIGAEYGWAWGAIAGGAILLLTSLLAAALLASRSRGN